MESDRYALIVNPRSGRGKGKKLLPLVRAWFTERHLAYEVRLTERRGHARELARAAADEGAAVIVVLGGDGTLFEVVNGVMESAHRPRLAQLPVGTGNSFIKDLAIETLEDGLAALEGGRTMRVDLCRGSSSAGSFWFINLAGAGFVARVARRALGLKGLGSLAYVVATLLELPGLKPRPLHLVVDGVSSTRNAVFIEVCNSRKTGGDMIMAPDALVDDGLMNVVIARAMKRGALLRLFPQIFDGTHVSSPLVETFTCRTIEARFERPEPVTPDGELLGATPFSASVHPGMLEIFAR